MKVIVDVEVCLRVVDDNDGIILGRIFVPCDSDEIAAAKAISAAIRTEPGVGWQMKGEAEQFPIAYKSWLESNDKCNNLENLFEWLEMSGIELSTRRIEAARMLKGAACLA